PSQVNEMWAWHPQILAAYAVHHATGEPMPAAWVERKLASRQWGEGQRTTEYLAAAILDQAWHRLTPDEVPSSVEDVEPFEAAALERAGIALDLVPPRYRTTYFNHAFGGGYSAAYYSYIWSEVLDADTVEWFEENGGLNREAGERFRRTLLGRGGSLDPMRSFVELRGREPRIEPLLARRGLDAGWVGGGPGHWKSRERDVTGRASGARCSATRFVAPSPRSRRPRTTSAAEDRATVRNLDHSPGEHTTLSRPVSSSIDKNVTPCAVPGRWR